MYGCGRKRWRCRRRDASPDSRHLPHQRRRHPRLIALHVDHNGVIRPAEPGRHLGQPVSAGGMRGRSHAHRRAKALSDLTNARVVGGDHHLQRAAGQRPPVNVFDQRPTGQQPQRLARQPGRGVAGRNRHPKLQFGLTHSNRPRHRSTGALRLPASPECRRGSDKPAGFPGKSAPAAPCRKSAEPC